MSTPTASEIVRSYVKVHGRVPTSAELKERKLATIEPVKPAPTTRPNSNFATQFVAFFCNQPQKKKPAHAPTQTPSFWGDLDGMAAMLGTAATVNARVIKWA